MQAQALLDHGLDHLLGGSDYNFRYAVVGEAMAQDLTRLNQALNYPAHVLYTGTQCHGDRIEYCDGQTGEDFLGGKTFPETDGLITDQPGVGLVIKFADCTPILLYDPVAKVQALLHAGWRGTVQGIGAKAVGMMVEDYGCDLGRILAFVGPSIDQANYEVGQEVYEAFHDSPSRDKFFQPGPVAGKYYLSMTQANYYQLLGAGLSEGNITVSQASTYEDPRLHSARQEGSGYGLNAMVSVMVNER